jgi:hypothetical protein
LGLEYMVGSWISTRDIKPPAVCETRRQEPGGLRHGIFFLEFSRQRADSSQLPDERIEETIPRSRFWRPSNEC